MKRAATVVLWFVLAACGQTTPTPTPSSVATPATSPSEAVPTAANLTVQGTVRSGCGSFGGCAYFAELTDATGQIHEAEFAFGRGGGAIVVDDGLPATLAAGEYTLTLTSNLMSDVLLANGEREIGPVDARCVETFEVAPGQVVVVVHAVFDKAACEIEIAAS